MSKSSAKRGQFWRTDWFVAVVAILAVLALQRFTDVFDTLERRYYDFASTATSRQPSSRVAVCPSTGCPKYVLPPERKRMMRMGMTLGDPRPPGKTDSRFRSRPNKILIDSHA